MVEEQERISIEERIGDVLASGNLSGNSVRVVTALGIVGITEPLAQAVFRLKYSNEAASYPQVLADVRHLARWLNAQRNWRLRRSRLDDMAKAVLDYWLLDTCPACKGRAWKVVPGSPYLSDAACPACLERPGKRPYPWLLIRPRIKIRDKAPTARKKELLGRRRTFNVHIERYKELLCEIESGERHVGEKVIRALAGSVRQLNAIVYEGETEIDR